VSEWIDTSLLSFTLPGGGDNALGKMREYPSSIPILRVLFFTVLLPESNFHPSPVS